MQESVQLKWKDGLSFEANSEEYKIMIDADPEHGGQGKGPRPKPLMMVALAGCTGMDVVSLMNKMRVSYDSFNVKVIGDLTEEHPKHFTKMKVIFEVRGKDIDVKKVEKAVELSREKYCGVSVSYNKAMELEYEIKIL